MKIASQMQNKGTTHPPSKKSKHPPHTQQFISCKTKQQETLGSREARPAVSGGFQPTELLGSAFTSSTNKAQVLGEQIPLILTSIGSLKMRKRFLSIPKTRSVILRTDSHLPPDAQQ
jgi:hypothetical protein